MAAVADATVLQAAPNDNNGAYSQLALFDSKHRTVTAFDRDELQAFVDGHGLEIAQLVMSAADRSQGGGVHWLAAVPLHGAFVEGNGETLGGDRGTGAGATWNCAEDADISDAVAECVQNWPRRFGTGKGVRVVEPDGFNGKTSFDVTDDVMDGVSAWVIRLERGSSAAHHSREAADELDDPSLAPTLILTPVRETTAQGK